MARMRRRPEKSRGASSDYSWDGTAVGRYCSRGAGGGVSYRARARPSSDVGNLRPPMPIERQALLEFLRSHRYAVQSSVHASGTPQSAVVGIAVSDRFEIAFRHTGRGREAAALRHHESPKGRRVIRFGRSHA